MFTWETGPLPAPQDGTLLVAVETGGNLAVWKLANLKCRGWSESEYGLEFTPGSGGRIRAWSLIPTGKVTREVQEPDDAWSSSAEHMVMRVTTAEPLLTAMADTMSLVEKTGALADYLFVHPDRLGDFLERVKSEYDPTIDEDAPKRSRGRLWYAQVCENRTPHPDLIVVQGYLQGKWLRTVHVTPSWA